MPRFAVLPVAGALGLYHVRRHFQRDIPVGASAAAGEFRVVMLDGDVVSEESRPLAAGVGDQRLLPVEFQSEGFPEEFGYPGLDFLGLRFRVSELNRGATDPALVPSPA